MAKLTVTLDGVVIREDVLTKDKTTLGRRPYNDIVIDNLAVSGEHAVITVAGFEVYIEDLNSTNGTYVNARAVKKQRLNHNDQIEIGKYKLRFQAEEEAGYEKTQMVARPPQGPAFAPAPTFDAPSNFGGMGGPQPGPASIRVLNGAAAGREVALTKVVTTVGKPGVQVASITKRPGGYVFAHVEGIARPTLNGQPLTTDSVHLRSGDVIELAGAQMQFIQE
jgi:pSer/pThr/pTyr-binding forkhead associated (FHA) protein